jgi:hypothetical protein
MPGLGLSLVVSKNIPPTYREKCFVRGVGNPVVVTTLIDKFLMDVAIKLRQP